MEVSRPLEFDSVFLHHPWQVSFIPCAESLTVAPGKVPRKPSASRPDHLPLTPAASLRLNKGHLNRFTLI